MNIEEFRQLVAWDHAHVWHPFTPMRQWREGEPLIIEAGEGDFLIDTQGRRYLDGVSSLWCNVHGHRVPELDEAIRGQLDRVAHTTMLGLANVPATQLAARLAAIAPGGLEKVFYTDAGATATEVAFKMAVGYWHHRGEPDRTTFIAVEGAYHGDTMGAVSVGYSETFHKAYKKLVFHTEWVESPDCFHTEYRDDCCQHDLGISRCEAVQDRSGKKGWRVWSGECEIVQRMVREVALRELGRKLKSLSGSVAAVVVEPIVQGAAGMIMQPAGYLAGVEKLCREHGVLLIADEVAVGFGRTGRMFACEHEGVTPDIMCLGKGITGGYLPLAATLATDEIASAFEGELHEHRTLYHGHTYTGNPLAAAAAVASLDLFEKNELIEAVNRKAKRLGDWLNPLRDGERFPMVVDVRQRGLMVGIELAQNGQTGTGFDPSRRLGHAVCDVLRGEGILLRPLGNVVVLMPPLAISEDHLKMLAEKTVEAIARVQNES